MARGNGNSNLWPYKPEAGTCPDKIRVWFPPLKDGESGRGGTCGLFVVGRVLMGNDTNYKVIFEGSEEEEEVFVRHISLQQKEPLICCLLVITALLFY